jgi:hypothetical protein
MRVVAESTIGMEKRRLPDRKSDTWSQNISILSYLSDFEVFEVNTIVDNSKGRPIEAFCVNK